jgi:2,3-bisphosphoglycerate-independent phosphoglycerate mutase
MKTILILLDGVGDRAYKELDYQTPLQAASTPNLDQFARLGSNGLFHAASPGQCLPSETAHYLLFGYQAKNFPGRGFLEAVGYGVPLEDADVLCLAHLCGIEWQDDVPILAHGRDETLGDETVMGRFYETLSPYETDGIRFQLVQTRRNDAVLIIRGDVSPHISDSDPIIMGRPVARIQALDPNPEPLQTERTARAMNGYLSHCHQTLVNHPLNQWRQEQGFSPVNFLATHRAGRRIKQEPFQERWAMKGVIIASDAIYMGLAHELGLDGIRVKNSNDPGRDLRDRIRMALEDHDHDFIHVHTKMPDEAGHTKNPKNKQAVLTSLDHGMDEILDAVTTREDILAVVTGDHSTPSGSILIHSGEPVPIVFTGTHVRRDDVALFDEIHTAKGCLGFIRGRELMLMVLNYMNRSTLIGHQLGPRPRPYSPETYDSFVVHNEKGNRTPDSD